MEYTQTEKDLIEYITELKVLVGCLISEKDEKDLRQSLLNGSGRPWQEQAISQLDKCRQIDSKIGIF